MAEHSTETAAANPEYPDLTNQGKPIRMLHQTADRKSTKKYRRHFMTAFFES
jgi:hypothetical protein